MNATNQNSGSVQLTPDFEKAEMDLLRATLAKTYTERFHMMTALMKMGLMLKKAKITHKASPLKS